MKRLVQRDHRLVNRKTMIGQKGRKKIKHDKTMRKQEASIKNSH